MGAKATLSVMLCEVASFRMPHIVRPLGANSISCISFADHITYIDEQHHDSSIRLTRFYATNYQLLYVHGEARHLWQIRCPCQIQYVYIIVDIISIGASKDEQSTVGQDGRMITSSSGGPTSGCAILKHQCNCARA